MERELDVLEGEVGCKGHQKRNKGRTNPQAAVLDEEPEEGDTDHKLTRKSWVFMN